MTTMLRTRAFDLSFLAQLSLCCLSLSLNSCDAPNGTGSEDSSTQPDEDEEQDTGQSKDKKKSKKKSKNKKKKKSKEDPKDNPSDEQEEGEDEDSSDASSSEKGEASSTGSDASSTNTKDESDDNSEDKSGEKSGPIPCEGDSPKVVMETTLGPIVLTLDGKRMPITVKNFIQYVNDHHYDQTIFHRVISDFMIQGGGYDTNNKLKKDRPPIKLETHPDLKHKAGTLAMARTDVKDSATAQFYICINDSGCKHLDGQYAAFGQAVEGFAVIEKISKVPKGGQDKPKENVVLTKAYCVKP